MAWIGLVNREEAEGVRSLSHLTMEGTIAGEGVRNKAEVTGELEFGDGMDGCGGGGAGCGAGGWAWGRGGAGGPV